MNGIDQGVAVPDVPQPCHALVDLYGQCEQVSRLPAGWRWRQGAQGWVSLITPPLQVTIMSPEPGATSGKSAGTQGDMEKADMVDGEAAPRSPGAWPCCPHYPCDPAPFCPLRHQGECVLGPSARHRPAEELRVPCPLLPLPRTAIASR